MYMSGKLGNVRYPAPLILNGQALPWVTTATYLGHELSQSVNMERDAKLKRMQFISKSTDIREMFDFAHPTQVLETVSIYTVHFYGAMLWDLYGKEAGKVYRSWNTCVKLAWQVPRSTHTYLVENLLALELPSVKQKLLCQENKE